MWLRVLVKACFLGLRRPFLVPAPHGFSSLPMPYEFLVALAWFWRRLTLRYFVKVLVFGLEGLCRLKSDFLLTAPVWRLFLADPAAGLCASCS